MIALEAGEGGRFTETLSNGKVFEIGRVTAWEPGSRLALTWRQATFAPDQMTTVEVLFEPVGEETRITVVHSGWDSIPFRMRCSCAGTRNGGSSCWPVAAPACGAEFFADAVRRSRHTRRVR
jgi:uncharacterized protein YndB with AHSA1/START domain